MKKMAFEQIRPWMRRLQKLALRRAAWIGLNCGLFAFALSLLIRRLIHLDGMLLPLLIGGAVLAIGLGVAYLILRPTEKQTVKRLDALGLKERASTMLSLRDSDSELAILQRKDALRHITKVKTDSLRGKTGWVLPIASILVILLAYGTAAAPDTWFATATASSVYDDIINMLLQERDDQAANGETALAEVLDSLAEGLAGADSELSAAGMINEAETAVSEAAQSGQSSESAASDVQETLEDAMNALTGEESGEGEESESGEAGEDGQPPENGEAPEDGEQNDGEPPEGAEPPDDSGQEMPEQSMGGSGNEVTSNMTEPVYDPISGNVQYGDVFAAYYAEYIQDTRSGSIPTGIVRAADSYFESLNQ